MPSRSARPVMLEVAILVFDDNANDPTISVPKP
jgi:hypothetical protein